VGDSGDGNRRSTRIECGPRKFFSLRLGSNLAAEVALPLEISCSGVNLSTFMSASVSAGLPETQSAPKGSESIETSSRQQVVGSNPAGGSKRSDRFNSGLRAGVPELRCDIDEIAATRRSLEA